MSINSEHEPAAPWDGHCAHCGRSDEHYVADQDRAQRARRMRAGGVRPSKIMALFGVDYETYRSWIDSGQARPKRRAIGESKLLELQFQSALAVSA